MIRSPLRIFYWKSHQSHGFNSWGKVTLDELIKAKDFQKALTHIESHKDNGIPDKHLRSIKIVFLPKCLI